MPQIDPKPVSLMASSLSLVNSRESGALYLSEYLLDLNEGAGFLGSLPESASKAMQTAAFAEEVPKGASLFQQGQRHHGVWIIESGRVRSYYTGPSGREITLAYWSEGHFVGGPEVFGRGRHMWSADTVEATTVLFLSGEVISRLVREYPAIAVAVIEGLVAKGKCYSALIQMLGTRSVSERLKQLLLILADLHGTPADNGDIVVTRSITYDQVASIVGASRQWVAQSLDSLQEKGVLSVNRREIRIPDPQLLSE